MFFSKKASAILGMNARNLVYLSKYNSSADKRFADDKIYTKNFLQSRNIGAAKLYHVVKQDNQLTEEFFAGLPDKFVIKPNAGFAGAGILVIVEKKGKYWITISGKKIDAEHMRLHCIEILEGKYSISGVHDDVIFEEVLEGHPDFRILSESGLPDIRVIVFNLVPVMAMLRVPTAQSEGKANMELGAIAMGIDMGTGKTTGAAKKSTFIRKMPNGESAIGFQIPFWDEILLSCAKIQQTTGIGFLGVDLTVTKSGVKVLEVNARPGLKIQVANRVPMRQRLEKVSDLKVITPEDGVEVAKTLFSDKPQGEDFEVKPVIGPQEHVTLNLDEPTNAIANIYLGEEENYIHPKFIEGAQKIVDLTIAGKRLKLPFKVQEKMDADIIIAGKYLKEFYIDPNKTLETEPTKIQSQVEEKKLLNIDEKLAEIDTQIKTLSFLNPRNLKEQRDLFFQNKDYHPRFIYREINLDIPLLRKDLKRIPQIDHPLFPLYKAKIEEIDAKLSMIESRGTEDLGTFSQKVYGKVTRHYYTEALKFVQETKLEEDESEELDLKDAMEVIRHFLDQHKLEHWSMKVMEDTVVDIQVTKKEQILMRKGATFQRNRLDALLVHEIGTHVFRFENGKRQPLRIFERGTAGYLRTEEGLAVWNQNQLGLPLGMKQVKSGYLIIAIYMAEKMGFRDLFQYLQTTFNLDDDICWNLCIKAKRGLENPDIKTSFTKDMVYFAGLRDIERFVKKHDVKELYVGKICIDDLKYLEHIEDMKEPKYVL